MKIMPQVFLSYAREDERTVENLHQKLSDAGIRPWMDKKDLLPGERWESSAQTAIRRSDFFLACLSSKSVSKRGFLQKEIKNALDIWQEKLDSDIYLIPVRLQDCKVPESLCKFQWVNLFEEDGWTRLVKAIQEGMARRGEDSEWVPDASSDRATRLRVHEYVRVELDRQLDLLLSIRKALDEQASEYSSSRIPTDLGDEIDFLDCHIAELDRKLAALGSGADSDIAFRGGPIVYPRQSFIGRADELSKILPVLGPLSPNRFILIKGPSGVGKSAFAREAAYQAIELGLVDAAIVLELRRAPELANRLDPIDYLVESIRAQVSISSKETLDMQKVTRLRAVQEVLSGAKHLIIVDNLEGSTHVRTQVLDFLRDAVPAESKVIITSTYHLTNADYIFNLDGMKYAEAAMLMRTEACMKALQSIAYADSRQLKRAWAWASRLPLAMQWLIGYASEAAVGFDRLLTKFEHGEAEEAALLNTLFERSFKLIHEDQAKRDVMFALAVFETHGTLESISHVSRVRGACLEDAIGSLYRLSLVQFDDFNEEYSLLPITRRFAIKSAGGMANLGHLYERAVEYYRSIVGGLDAVRSQSTDIWHQLNRERQNIMAVLDWCIAHDKWESFIDIGLTMNAVLGYTGLYQARLKYAYQLLKAAEQLEKPALQAWILVHEVGWINQHIGDYEEAEAATRQGLSIAIGIGDVRTVALAKRNLGILLYRRAKREADPETRRKQFEGAWQLSEDALELYEAENELRWKAITLRLLAMIAKETGEFAQAQTIFEKALELHRQVSDWESEALTISDLGELALCEDDLDRAKTLLQKALALDEKHNRPFGCARNRQRLARVEARYGNMDAAAVLLKEALSVFQEMGAVKAIEVLNREAEDMGVALT